MSLQHLHCRFLLRFITRHLRVNHEFNNAIKEEKNKRQEKQKNNKLKLSWLGRKAKTGRISKFKLPEEKPFQNAGDTIFKQCE